MPDEPVRVVIADDHHLTRQGLRTALSGVRGIDVIGEAADGEEALRVVRDARPDVAILDIEMPKLSGVQVARELQREHLQVAVLALSAHASREYFYGLVDAGASGYLMKEEADPDVIVEAVLSIARDPEELWISPSFAGRIVRGQLQRQRVERKLGALTEREREMFLLVARGKTNIEIGDKVSLSPHTVKNHVDRVKQKLDVRTRAELIAWAWEKGLIDRSDEP